MSFIKQPGALHSVPKTEPKVQKYTSVVNGSGLKGGLFDKPNIVAEYQRVFQAGSEPIHLKTAFQRKYFRFVMPFTYAVIAGSLGTFMVMALGKMKKNK